VGGLRVRLGNANPRAQARDAFVCDP